MIKVIFLTKVREYTKRLMRILYKKGYFGFEESAQKYVDDLIYDIEITLPLRVHKSASQYFDQYGKNMKYAVFKKNRNTTWYVFFTTYNENEETVYLVRYVANNHTIAQYL